MEALDRLRDYQADINTLEHLRDTLEEYKRYLDAIEKLSPPFKEAYLRLIAKNELVNNQEMEHEDEFLIQLGLEIDGEKKKNSISVMTDSILENKPLSITKFKQLHRLLIRGTSDDIERNYDIRDFETYVHEFVDGVEKVSYIPPTPTEIRPYLRNIIKYLNESDTTKEDTVLLNSILIHFYIAALQPFGNGNTRLSRLLEYGSIFKLTRDILHSEITSPALFASGRYLVSRKNYRDYISLLVNAPTDENFNRWLNYNLNMLDEQLTFNSFELQKIHRRRF